MRSPRPIEVEAPAAPDEIEGWPLPRERGDWLGDPAVEAVLAGAHAGGRMAHAWLIGGPKGIGKATLAYRFARFVLAHPDPAAAAGRSDLAVSADHPAFRRIAAGAHPNLLALERPWNERDRRYRTVLTVDEIRRTVPFFGSTPGEAGWRVAIVDPADEMNDNAANALLKILEEPPPRSLILIVAHAPARILPTIRSRCRQLQLSPLPFETIVGALSRAGEGEEAERTLAARLSDGSLRRAILLLQADGIALYRRFGALLSRLPALDIEALHGFAGRVSGRGADDAYRTFLDLLRDWLRRRVRREAEPEGGIAVAPGIAAAPLERWAEVWEKAAKLSADADEYNLDRKQVVLSIFMALARATRM